MASKAKDSPELGAKLNQIDESTLEWRDRLGLCYVRLLRYQWDDILGPKPKDFDSLPNCATVRSGVKKKSKSKSDYINLPLALIRSIIGEMEASRYYWTLYLGISNEEWLRKALLTRQIMAKYQTCRRASEREGR